MNSVLSFSEMGHISAVSPARLSLSKEEWRLIVESARDQARGYDYYGNGNYIHRAVGLLAGAVVYATAVGFLQDHDWYAYAYRVV